MGWFKHDTNKKVVNSVEYEDCLRRIVKINSEVELLKAHLEAYKMQLDNLRGNFSRKLKAMSEEEEKVGQKEEEKENENLNNGGYVPFG